MHAPRLGDQPRGDPILSDPGDLHLAADGYVDTLQGEVRKNVVVNRSDLDEIEFGRADRLD